MFSGDSPPDKNAENGREVDHEVAFLAGTYHNKRILALAYYSAARIFFSTPRRQHFWLVNSSRSWCFVQHFTSVLDGFPARLFRVFDAIGCLSKGGGLCGQGSRASCCGKSGTLRGMLRSFPMDLDRDLTNAIDR